MAFRKVSVGTVVVQLASFNPKRVAISIVNASGEKAFIHTNQVEVTTEGWPLAPDASISFIKADGDHPEEALFAQTTTGTADLRVQESWE